MSRIVLHCKKSTSSSKMIYADIHEPEKIIRRLQENLPVKVQKNVVADYIFSNIGIERKTLSDFFSSLVSERLITQLENMLQFKESYLVIEGFFDFSHVNNPACLYHAMQWIAIDLNTSIVFTKDADETAEVIRRIYFRQFKFQCIKKRRCHDIKTVALRSFFQISHEKLDKLLFKFGTLRELAHSDAKSIESVEGIGKRTAEKIMDGFDSGFKRFI